MAKRYTNNTNTNTNNNTNNNRVIDWSQLMAQAMFDGGQAFLHFISSATPGIDETSLQAEENRADRRLARAIDSAKLNRANPESYILSAIRNWARKQAIAILRQKIAGKQISPDFYIPFQDDLQDEITSLFSDLQLFWDQEDQQREEAEEKRSTAKREESEQAFGRANKYVIGLHDAILDGERQRQTIFNDGVLAAEKWANKYEDSVRRREEALEARVKLIDQQERENREHQLALRSLATWDDKRSFVDTVVSTGKNTVGCLVLWFCLLAGILLAIYFAFPAHH
jgi:hypothetical protein